MPADTALSFREICEADRNQRSLKVEFQMIVYEIEKTISGIILLEIKNCSLEI